jgi:hypothetical protein
MQNSEENICPSNWSNFVRVWNYSVSQPVTVAKSNAIF